MIDLDDEFPLDPGLSYLNHAAVAPWPRRAAEAVDRFARENQTRGAEHYPDWLRVESQLREQLRRLINAPSAEDIALVKNTSEALSMVAYGLSWKPGDRIVISDQEFPSNRIVWESLADQGVVVDRVDLAGAETPEGALIGVMGTKTRLLAISAVQYASGLRLDLQALGQACREREILFCVDAIQAIGATVFDAQAAQADFVIADGHKWMLGPEGLGLFYCRAPLRERLRLYEYGWHMVKYPGDYDRTDWEVAHGARRFECGSPNLLGTMALHASTGLLLEYGMGDVEINVLKNISYLIEKLDDIDGIKVLSDTSPGRYAGIVTFAHERVSPEELYERLRATRVICAQRGGGIRLSPHFYTPTEQLDRALAVIEAAV
jgi:cysteine desulfurase/selenocysteine lyase